MDIALVPFWFYSSSQGRKLTREVFKAKHEVAVHIPQKGRGEILDDFAKEFPGVVVFKKEMEARSFPL